MGKSFRINVTKRVRSLIHDRYKLRLPLGVFKIRDDSAFEVETPAMLSSEVDPLFMIKMGAYSRFTSLEPSIDFKTRGGYNRQVLLNCRGLLARSYGSSDDLAFHLAYDL